MLKIKVNCGCGFFSDRADALHLGIRHADVQGHEVEVRGTITRTDPAQIQQRHDISQGQTETGRIMHNYSVDEEDNE